MRRWDKSHMCSFPPCFCLLARVYFTMPKIHEYIEAYRRRAMAAQVAVERRAKRAHEMALGCAKKLVEDFGAVRVFLIGSLAEGCFRATSDIDLVVEGLAPALYFRASAKISRIAGEFEVDLIPWETYKYKAEVLEKGKLLYECRRPENAASADRRGAEGNGKTSRADC